MPAAQGRHRGCGNLHRHHRLARAPARPYPRYQAGQRPQQGPIRGVHEALSEFPGGSISRWGGQRDRLQPSVDFPVRPLQYFSGEFPDRLSNLSRLRNFCKVFAVFCAGYFAAP